MPVLFFICIMECCLLKYLESARACFIFHLYYGMLFIKVFRECTCLFYFSFVLWNVVY